jgi:hypothetical protein
MNRREQVLALAGGVAAGLAGGLFGVGGGIVLVPLLVGGFGLRQHQAHGTSLAVIGATAVTSLVVYGAHGHVAWATAALIGVASALTAPLGARVASRVPAWRLRRAFAVFLLLVALRLLWRQAAPVGAPGHGAAATLTFDLMLGSLVGLTAGFMGVGGGVLAVPALTLVADMSQQLAQGTSLAVILVAAPVGAWEHSRHGNVFWRIVPAMAVGAALGGPASSWLANRLPGTLLTQGFALLILATAVQLWRTAGGMAHRPGESSPI